MSAFPAVDPIPLPAPLWLFKALHVVTLALHFVSVELLLGGLLVATWLNLFGVGRRGDPAGVLRLTASAALARRLPIVMTYVINLGVPPLLFAQVLYGRALYTSSVLIGVYWITVVFLLMACYWLLYRFATGAEAGRAVWWQGLLAWLIAGAIARIYSTNMTLMLRPEVWPQMYASSAGGLHLPPYDPTLLPRWVFMLTGGFWVAGLWMIWLAGRKSLEAPVRDYLAVNGGRLAAIMVPVQAGVAFLVLSAQPEIVRRGLFSEPLYRLAGFGWIATVVLAFLFATWAWRTKPATRAAGWVSAALVLAAMLAMTTFRDGLRDVTLAGKGFFDEPTQVVTNWSVVGLFLGVFVVGLGGLAWLISVMMRAKPVAERLAR